MQRAKEWIQSLGGGMVEFIECYTRRSAAEVQETNATVLRILALLCRMADTTLMQREQRRDQTPLDAHVETIVRPPVFQASNAPPPAPGFWARVMALFGVRR